MKSLKEVFLKEKESETEEELEEELLSYSYVFTYEKELEPYTQAVTPEVLDNYMS